VRPSQTPAGGFRSPQGGASMQQPLFTVPEVAALLRVKPSTVRAYAQHGVLPCVRIGNRLRFVPSDIDQWIELRRSKGGR
jgi:excisionase family DNA binding protein